MTHNPLFSLRSIVLKRTGITMFLVLLVFGGVYAAQLYQDKSARHAYAAGTNHYFYTFPDGSMYVYDIDNNFSLVKHISLPTTAGVRGVTVDPTSGMLYVSYGGNGGNHGNGSLLKYNLVTDTLVYTINYNHGVDALAVTRDGSKIYLPEGSAAMSSTSWYIINPANGAQTGSISAGTQPHNTSVSLDGKHVYMGGVGATALYQASTATDKVTEQIGPLKYGVRPFTYNGMQTLSFTTASSYLGFQVGSITTGKLLYTVPVNGFTNTTNSTEPSHGISLSPNEKEVYVIDTPNDYVHVFDVSGLPAKAPTQVADIHLSSVGGNESPCAFDCAREGWVLHSYDGRYVFVGDSGDVIDTAQRKIVKTIDTLANTRKFLEVDWANGAIVDTTTQAGLGYVTGSTTSTPTPTSSVTSTPTTTSSPTPTSTPGSTSNTIEDNFTRTNQTGWGTSTNNSGVANVAWGTDASGSASYVTINNTMGTYGYPGTINVPGVASAGTATYNGGDVLASFTVSTVGHVLPYVVQNACGNKSCYYGLRVQTSSNSLQIAKRVNGSTSILKSSTFTLTANKKYWMRLDVNPAIHVVAGKIWADGTAEPASWTLSVTDSSPLVANLVGMGGSWTQTGTGETIKYSCFAYATSGTAKACA